jgi:hypothetical protein
LYAEETGDLDDGNNAGLSSDKMDITSFLEEASGFFFFQEIAMEKSFDRQKASPLEKKMLYQSSEMEPFERNKKRSSNRPVLPPIILPKLRKGSLSTIEVDSNGSTPQTSTPKPATKFHYPDSTIKINSMDSFGKYFRGELIRSKVSLNNDIEAEQMKITDPLDNESRRTLRSDSNLSGITCIGDSQDPSSINPGSITDDSLIIGGRSQSDDNEPLTKAKELEKPKILDNIEKTEREGKFEEINLILKRNRLKAGTKLKKNEMMTVGVDYNVPKAIQESLELLAGEEVDKEKIIQQEGFRLKRYIKIRDIEEFRKVRRDADNKQTKLRNQISNLKTAVTSVDGVEIANEVTRERWICAVHYSANMGVLALKAMTDNIKAEAVGSGNLRVNKRSCDKSDFIQTWVKRE